MRRRLIALLTIAVSSVAVPARAVGPLEDPRAFPEAAHPATLPELTHADGEGTIDLTSGSYIPRGTSAIRGHVPLHALHVGIDQPILGRHLFVGGAWNLAVAQPEQQQGLKPLAANPEISGRAVWATSTGMSFGGGLSVFLPIPSWTRGTSPAQDIANAAITLHPWDVSAFNEGYLAFRPFVDIRDVLGRLVLQGRQSLDVAFDIRESYEYRIFAVGTFFAGYRVTDSWAMGIEIHEMYVIEAPVADERRAFFTVAPTIRGVFQRLQPSLSVLTNVGPPYYPGSERYVAIRSGLTALW